MSGAANCCLEVVRSPAQRLLGGGRALFQLDNVDAEICRFAPAGSDRRRQSPRAPVISLRAVRSNSLNSP